MTPTPKSDMLALLRRMAPDGLSVFSVDRSVLGSCIRYTVLVDKDPLKGPSAWHVVEFDTRELQSKSVCALIRCRFEQMFLTVQDFFEQEKANDPHPEV